MVTANLLTGLGIDEVFTRTDSVGTREFFSDALGSTVALADTSGAVQTSYTYEAFGGTTQTGSASTNSYKYTGREDDGTGLYYYRARYYSPRLQRFISEDPIGFRGGDQNLYAYVRVNPISSIDPNGLGPNSFYACSVVNAIKQIWDVSSTLTALGEATQMTSDLLVKVNKDIATCPSSDINRLQQLEGIQKNLRRSLLRSTGSKVDRGSSGLQQVAEGLVWEGVCALLLALPVP